MERGRFNYGIACGPSGLVVIDLDTPKPGEATPPEWAQPGINDGADALASIAERDGHTRDFARMLDTFTVRTRRDGLHLYFTAPEGVRMRNTAGKLGWLIDTRAHGGYVVGPGSYVADDDASGTYRVANPAPPAPLPAWLANRLTTGQPRPMPPRPALDLATTRNLASYATVALRSELERVLATQAGQRNHTLNAAAFALGQLVGSGVLPQALVEDALTQAGRHIGLGERECEATIRSGLTAGLRAPRTAA